MSSTFRDSEQQVMRYCTTCPKMCRFACPVAHIEARETVTPWGLMSLLNLANQGAVPFDDETAQTLMHCTGCLRCQTACMHHNHIPQTLFAGRARARALGLELGYTAPRDGHAEGSPHLEGEALGFCETSTLGFWPSCSSRGEEAAEVRRIAKLFSALGLDVELINTTSMCCGYPQYASGESGLARERSAQLAAVFEDFDVVLTDCEQLLALTLTEGWRTPFDEAGARVVHWTEHIAQGLEQGEIPSPPSAADTSAVLVYHDACRLGRGGGVYDGPRTLLNLIAQTRELGDTRDEALCCGAGAGYANVAPEAAKQLAQGIAADVRSVGGAQIVTASSTCACHFERALDSELKVSTLAQVLCDALGLNEEE